VGRTALAGERMGDRRERRTEFRGGEGVQGTEAACEFGRRQAAHAIEPAEKIPGGTLPFLGVVFYAARDQIAVGIASQLRTRHDVVQALHRRRGLAQTVEALAAFARVDRLSQRPVLQKVRLLEANRRTAARALSLASRPSRRLSLTARISSGSLTSTTCPALLRFTRRKTPWPTSRRTASRVGPPVRWIARASQRIENRRRSFPSRRLCRRR
jgi:hypothetical protein